MRFFSREQLVRITFVWVCAAAAMGPVLLATVDGRFRWPWAHLLLAGSAWLALTSIHLFRRVDDSTVFKRLFVRVNAYGCMVMLCLVGSAMASG
jgi:hypothetical protein